MPQLFKKKERVIFRVRSIFLSLFVIGFIEKILECSDLMTEKLELFLAKPLKKFQNIYNVIICNYDIDFFF